jgi:hypothetical protein
MPLTERGASDHEEQPQDEKEDYSVCKHKNARDLGYHYSDTYSFCLSLFENPWNGVAMSKEGILTCMHADAAGSYVAPCVCHWTTEKRLVADFIKPLCARHHRRKARQRITLHADLI